MEEVDDELYCSDDEDIMKNPTRKAAEMDQTSMFCNKYETDTNLPTVANRMADMIIDYESSNNIDALIEDDFEQEYTDVEFEPDEITPEQKSFKAGDVILLNEDEVDIVEELFDAYLNVDNQGCENTQDEIYNSDIEEETNNETIKDCKKDLNSRVPDEDIFYSDIEDEGNNKIIEKVIEKDLESSLDTWPSLKDLYGMKKSENPLIFAKNKFEQCNNLLHARITLKKKDLKLLNEVGIKLMENLDSLCAASDERKLLIKDINIFCDQIDQKINEKDNENQGDDNFDCQICRLSFLTEKELVNHPCSKIFWIDNNTLYSMSKYVISTNLYLL